MEELTSENQVMCDQSRNNQISEVTDPMVVEAISETGLLRLKLSEYTSMKRQESLEDIHSILLQLGQRCRRDDNFTSHLAQCFETELDIVTSLVDLIDSIFTNEAEISTVAVSCATLAHEVLRMVTDVNKTVLIEAAKAGIILTLLMELHLAKRLKYNKIVELLVLSIFGLIQIFAAEPRVLVYFKSTKFSETLSPYLEDSNKDIYLMCLITLAFLMEITKKQKVNVLALKPEEICGFVEILCEASSENDLTARDVYGSLVVPADDMLKLLKYLSHVELNCATLKDQLPFLLMSIELCINNGTDDFKLAALDLLSALIKRLASKTDISETLLASIDNLSHTSVSTSVSSMALCVLYSLKSLDLKDLPLLIKLAESSYKHRRYDESIQWTDILLEEARKSENHSAEVIALTLRGKSYFHIYRREQQVLQEDLPDLSPKEFHLQHTAVYGKTKKAIIDLGDSIDKDSLDKEASQFLDVSIIDLACQANGLRDIGRCLLCRQKAKLYRSHLCPDSILSAFETGLERTRNKRIFNLSFFKESELKSPHKIVKWLFCQNCEKTLCKDGEDHFVSKFFNKIYDMNNYQQPTQEMVIEYDEWLYRFALGIIFRSLVNEAITSFLNEEEIYSVFTTCRKLLLTKGSLDGLEKPRIHLLISPLTSSTDAGFIGHIHNAPFLFALTDKNLRTGQRTLPSNAHFLLSRIGIMNFLLLFKPGESTPIPDGSIIHSKQGSFRVPAEKNRAVMIPKGITSILDNLAVTIQKNFLEVTISGAKGLSLNDIEINPPSDSAREVFRALPGIEDDVNEVETGLPVSFSLDYSQELNLLPKGMEVQRSNRLVLLPANHSILFHGTFEVNIEGRGEYDATLFLIIGNDPQTPYVILHYFKVGLIVDLGFVISPDTLMPTKLLQDSDPKVFLPSIATQLNAADHIKKVLPSILKRKGLKTYYTIIHHLYLHWSVCSYDTVCYERCWYCKDRCNNCLKPSKFSFNVKHPNLPLIKSCSKTCQDVYLKDYFQPALPVLSQDDVTHPLLLSAHVPLKLGTGGYGHSHMSVFLGDGTKPFPKNDVYIVFQFRTPFEQTFLEYFLMNDCSFSHPLKYYKDEDVLEILQSSYIEFAELALQAEIKKTGAKDLNELINMKF